MSLTKKIITAFVALLLFAGLVFAEIHFSKQDGNAHQEAISIVSGKATIKRSDKEIQVVENTELVQGDVITTYQNEIAEIQLKGLIIRLSSDTSLKISLLSSNDALFILQKGKIWSNSQWATQKYIGIQAGNTLFIPQKAHFSLVFDGDRGNLIDAKNYVQVRLLSSTQPLQKFPKDGSELLNTFLIGEKNQISFSTSTISAQAETLKKLLYSKLVKEFQYGLVDATKWDNDQWLKQNIKNDQQLIQKKSQEVAENIHRQNLHYSSLNAFAYQLDAAVNRFASVLTFSENKNYERTADAIFAQLSDAKYLLVYGRTNEARERLSFFKQAIVDFTQQKPGAKEVVLQKLEKSYSTLEFALPDEPLYEVKDTVNEVTFSLKGSTAEDVVEKFNLLRDISAAVSDMATKNAPLARITLDQYFKRLTDFLPKEKKLLNENKTLLAEENQLVDNLFRQYSEFYQDSFFAQKYNLERQWLSLLSEGTGKNEERQTIMSTKIDFLKQLQAFFLAQKISLEESRKIAFRLINEIKDLQPGDEVGVKELFALRLKDYGQFLRFLNNTDVASFQNSSPQKRYEEFLAAQKEAITIEQAVDEFLGTQAKERLSPDQIAVKVQADLEARSITNITLGKINSSDQKIVTIETAIYQNIVFSAEYDWDRKLISQVKAGNETKAQNPIRLENIGQVLIPSMSSTQETQQTQTKTPRVPRTSSTSTQQTQATAISDAAKSERVTKVLLIQKLKSYDIATTEDSILIIDKAAGIFTIRNASLISNKNIVFDFRVNNKESTADMVTLKKEITKTLEESFALSDLSTKLKTMSN